MASTFLISQRIKGKHGLQKYENPFVNLKKQQVLDVFWLRRKVLYLSASLRFPKPSRQNLFLQKNCFFFVWDVFLMWIMDKIKQPTIIKQSVVIFANTESKMKHNIRSGKDWTVATIATVPLLSLYPLVGWNSFHSMKKCVQLKEKKVSVLTSLFISERLRICLNSMQITSQIVSSRL